MDFLSFKLREMLFKIVTRVETVLTLANPRRDRGR